MRLRWAVVAAGLAVIVIGGTVALFALDGGGSAAAQPSRVQPEFYFTPDASSREDAANRVSARAGFQAKLPSPAVAGLALEMVGYLPSRGGPGGGISSIVFDYYDPAYGLNDATVLDYRGVRIKVEQTSRPFRTPGAEEMGKVGAYALSFVFDPNLGREAGGEYYLVGSDRSFVVTVFSSARPIAGVPSRDALAPLFESLAAP